MKSTLKLKIIIFITFCMVTFVACRDDVSNESPALPSISSNTVSNDVQSDFVFILNNAGTEYGISAKENIKLKGEITIPAIYNAKPVTKIFNFTGQQEITRVVMSDNIREIDAGAFLYCTNLESIIFSNNLEIIDKSAFYTTGLISVTIPASVTTIGYMAFGNCNNLIDIEIFANEVNIGKEAFQACTKLTG
ncbi:MAG: leucine-rich repeat domain-containing protein, partial [Endomicrobium sp.]|nr:leucine-rich repeat domain-containing protein [Endomicrobium sp.]